MPFLIRLSFSDWLVILALGWVWALCAMWWLLGVYPEQEPELPVWYRDWIADDDPIGE